MTSREGSNRGDLVIVVGCDDRYALPLSVTLSSGLRHVAPNGAVRVVLVDGGLTPDSRRRLERVITAASPGTSLDWHIADQGRFSGLKVSKWGSTANYLRLLIPEIVGDDVDRVLYLDSDLLVRSDVSLVVAETTTVDAPVLAVGDYHHRRCATVYGLEGCQIIGVDPESPYFNSGVIVIDVSDWREQDVAGQAVDFVREHAGVMKHSDQDALNAVLANRWQPIDPLWNVMVPSIDRYLEEGRSHLTRDELLGAGHVLHFTGARKPWLPGYVGPAGFEYRRALRESSWFDDRAEWRRWHARFWLTSPPGWVREGYRRLRKTAGAVYRSIRRDPGS